MNNSVKNVIIFAIGAAVGGVSTWLGVKRIYEAKADAEVDSVKDAYERRLAEIDPVKTSVDDPDVKPDEEEESELYLKPSHSSIVNELNNKPPLTEYNKMFRSKSKEEMQLKEVTRDAKEDALNEEEIDPAELEGPEDDEPYTDEEDENETLEFEDYQLNGEHKKALEEGRAPYVIDKSDYELTCSNYGKVSYLYYIAEDMLVDDSDPQLREEVDVPRVVGDCLESSGFSENDDDILYVRNDILELDIEITKIFTPLE